MTVARVFRTMGGRLIDYKDVPFDKLVVEAAIRDRDELYGVHVHAFEPRPGRDWWLITWPLELEGARAAEELHSFTLGMLPDVGYIEMPKPIEDEHELLEILNQPVVFGKRVTTDGTYVDADVQQIGHRFVVAS